MDFDAVTLKKYHGEAETLSVVEDIYFFLGWMLRRYCTENNT